MTFPRDMLMLGCAPLGGLYHRVFTEDDVRKVVQEAVTVHGIRHIDTAPWYGHGKSEADLGNILNNSINNSSDGDSCQKMNGVLLYTKVGRVIRRRDQCDPNDMRVAWGDTLYAIVPQNKDVVPVHDYTASGIAESIRGSLERLRISTSNASEGVVNNARVVELRIHDAEDDERFSEATAPGGGVDELLRQCRKLSLAADGAGSGGRTGFAVSPSLGMNEPAYIVKFLRAYPPGTFRSVLMAGNWNLMDQSGLEVLELCEEMAVVQVHNAGIFGAGLLWGATKYRYGNASEETLRRRDQWSAICKELGVSLPAAAFAFARLPRAVTKIAFGCTSVDELRACVKAADESVSVPVTQLITMAQSRQLLSPAVASRCLKWAQASRL